MQQIQVNDAQESALHIIIQSLHAIDQFDTDKNNYVTADLENILYSLIQTFRHLEHGTCLSALNNHSKTLKQLTNVFRNILSSPIDFKLDLSIILFAYFSIFPNFNHLITHSDFDQYLSSNHKKNTTTPTDAPLPTVFDVVKQIESFKIFDKNLLSFLNWDISRETLLESWIQSSQKLHNYNNNNNNDTNALVLFNSLQNESDLGFYLINYMHSKTDPIVTSQPTTPSSRSILNWLYHKIILLNPKWIPKNLYNQAITTLLNLDRSIDSLEVNLQVLMELIDHPEYNLLEMPKFVILLYLSLSRIETVPCTQLHGALNGLGTTQTLLSLINMSQFVIAQFLNNISLVSDQLPNTGNRSVTSKSKLLMKMLYKIPGWFQREMLPDIPPISKSLFVFDTSIDTAVSLPFIDVLTILHQCLNSTIIIHNNITGQYHALKLNLIQYDDSITVQVEYLLKKQFFQNNYIPIFSTLLTLSSVYPHGNTPNNSNNSTNGSSSTVIKDQFYQMVYNSNFILHNIKKLITFNSIKYIESLITSYKDIALHHLLKFISLISQENLFLQKISIQILNHLFFHNNDNEYILSLCKKNELSINELSTYIKLWNDGTTNYSLFYSELLNEKQPMINIEKVSLRKIQGLVPNLETVIQYHEKQKQKTTTYHGDKSKDFKNSISSVPSNNYNFTYQTTDSIKNNIANNYNNNSDRTSNAYPGSFPQTIQPTPQKRMKNYMSINKYDAYTSPTFIPSGNNSMNNSTLVNTNNTFNNNSNNNHDIVVNGCYTPQAQQVINPGSSIYSTPMTYIQQQPMTSNFNGINIDNSNAMNMNFQGVNQNELYNTQGNFTIQSGFMGTPQNMSLSGTNNNNLPMLSPPNNTMFTSPWNDSPTMTLSTPQNKIVNTGKDYILGGHYRMQNNSRAQSIHIDQFENV